MFQWMAPYTPHMYEQHSLDLVDSFYKEEERKDCKFFKKGYFICEELEGELFEHNQNKLFACMKFSKSKFKILY